MVNNTNIDAYIKAVVKVLFTHMHAKNETSFFGERDIAAMVKEFKQLDEGGIPVNPVVIPLNSYEIIDSEKRK